MEEDKKEQNSKSVEKKESAQGGEKEEIKQENEDKKSVDIENPVSGNGKQKVIDVENNAQSERQNNTKNNEDENNNEGSLSADSFNKKEEEQRTEKKEVKTKTIYPNVVPGANIKVYEKIKEKKGKEEKERIQVFEGMVLARRGGNSAGATISVKKTCKGGFEVKKIYPLHSPVIAKIDILRQAKVRQAKLGFLKRDYKKKLKYKN